MLGSDIKVFFEKHPVLRRHFKGVFAADQIRSVQFQNRSFAVVNTDILHGGAGGFHWYCLAKLDRRLEVFDPLGVSVDTIKHRLGNKPCYFNSSPVQPEESQLCGYFCCYWVSLKRKVPSRQLFSFFIAGFCPTVQR